MIIVKIGGGAEVNIDAIIDDLGVIDEPFMIVHGANAVRDEIAEKLGVTKEVITSISGHSSVKSTDELLDVMLMSYAGLRNKRLVEKLRVRGYNAIGLTGADGGIIQGRRNRGIRVRMNGKRILVRDNSGKPEEVNKDLLELLIENGYIPVLTVPITDENGKLINSENDDIIATLCQNLPIRKVIMFIEEKGLLRNIEDPDSLVEQLDHRELKNWVEQTEGRIKRKLYAIQNMLNQDGPLVIISDGREEYPISHAINGNGTQISW